MGTYQLLRTIHWGQDMRKIVIALFILLFAVSAQAKTVTVVSVVDGDTLKVIDESGLTTIRLYGVDSPEKKQAFGLAAKDFVEMMTAGKVVDASPVGTDIYKRTIAVVMLGTQCLQEQLILAGYAWVYPQYCRKSFCEAWSKLQGISAGNRVGLWAGPAPVQPWEWRKMKKQTQR